MAPVLKQVCPKQTCSRLQTDAENGSILTLKFHLLAHMQPVRLFYLFLIDCFIVADKHLLHTLADLQCAS